MESGRGAERLLSPRLRQASARGVLALAAAATLVLFGCGEGSPDDRAASTPTSQGRQAEAGGPGNEPAAPGPNPVPGPGTQASSRQGRSSSQGEQGPGSQGQPRPVELPSGEREKGITPQQRAKATVLTMRLESPALASAATAPGGVVTLPAAYTCDGKDTWPELTWQGVPEGAAELALYVMSLQPVAGEPFYDWAVAGLDPSLTGIPSGRLPKGAVEGRNSSGKVGYTICPPKGSSETFLFALYALSKPLAAKRGFDPNAVRRDIVMQSGNSGGMAVSYGRG